MCYRDSSKRTPPDRTRARSPATTRPSPTAATRSAYPSAYPPRRGNDDIRRHPTPSPSKYTARVVKRITTRHRPRRDIIIINYYRGSNNGVGEKKKKHGNIIMYGTYIQTSSRPAEYETIEHYRFLILLLSHTPPNLIIGLDVSSQSISTRATSKR